MRYLYTIALRSVVKMRHLCIYGNHNTCMKSTKKPKDAIIRPVFISCLSDLKLPLDAVKFAKLVLPFKALVTTGYILHDNSVFSNQSLHFLHLICDANV